MTATELQLEPLPTYEKPAASSDAALIAAAIGGAESAFRELFRRHTPHLLQFVTRVLGTSRSDAEDVVQDTWLRAYPALVTFRSESSFSTWLCSVGLRAALDSMRRGKRHAAESLFEDDASSDPPCVTRCPGTAKSDQVAFTSADPLRQS